jgi:cyclic pyranopterin phosphate synthase
MLRSGTDDGHLTDELRAIWAGRDDRYSELRTLETVDLPKVEMSYIGG